MTDDLQQEQQAEDSLPAADQGLNSLFDDALHMLEVSFLCYTFADLREMARKKELEGDEAVLQKIIDLPCTIWDAHQLYTQNADKFGYDKSPKKEQKESTDKYNFFMSAENYALELASRRSAMESIEVLFFDDANNRDEMVYGIGIDKGRKRITVGFRGSATVQDFLQDSKVQTVSIPNPVAPELSKNVLVHQGFKEYLYGAGHSTKKDSTEVSKGGKCKVILDKIVSLCREYPGYQLFMTGHSLGAALAILTSFQAAAMSDEQIPKPITCISMASPKVGNWDFLRAFEELEDQSKRCRYWPVGVGLKLSPESCDVDYQPHLASRRSYVDRVGVDVGNIATRVLYLPFACLSCRAGCSPTRGSPYTEHSCVEYMRRLNLNEEKLTGLTLEGLYKDRKEK